MAIERRLLDDVEGVIAVRRHGLEWELASLNFAPIGEIDRGGAVAVEILEPQREPVFNVDPERLGFAAVGIDFDPPCGALADRSVTEEAGMVRRLDEGAGIDEVLRLGTAAQVPGQFAHVAALVTHPDAIAQPQRRLGARTEPFVVAFPVVVAPGVKVALQSFAREGAALFERRYLGRVRGAIVERENRRHRRRIGCTPEGGASEQRRERGEVTEPRGSGRTN